MLLYNSRFVKISVAKAPVVELLYLQVAKRTITQNKDKADEMIAQTNEELS